MRKSSHIIAALALGACLASPASASDNQLAGTLVGAGLGGLFGNQFGRGAGNAAATAAGIFVGAYAGNEIGKSLDNNNRRVVYAQMDRPSLFSDGPLDYYRPAYEPNYVAPPALPPQPPSTYINGRFDTYCREFSQRVRIGDQVQESYGTACLQPDGNWRIVQ